MRRSGKGNMTPYLNLALVVVGCLGCVHVFALGVEYRPEIVDVSFGGGVAETDEFNTGSGSIAINDEGTIAVAWSSNREIIPPIRGAGILQLMNGRGEDFGRGRVFIVSEVPGNVRSGSVVTGGSGDFFCVFLATDAFGSGEPYRIHLQRVDPLGYPLWTEDGLSLKYGYPEDPVLVSDSQGGVILSFFDAEQSLFLGQRFHPSGHVMWGAEPVPITIDPGPVYEPIAIPDRFGGAFVFWLSPSALEIYGQHISASGLRLWGDFGMPLVERTGAFDPRENTTFRVIPTSDGSFVIAFESETPISGVPVVRARKFSESGQPAWQASVRFDERPIQQKLGGIAPGPHGSFFYTGYTTEDAIISRIGADGTEQWKVWPLRGRHWSNVSIDFATGVVAVAKRSGGFMSVLALTAVGEFIPPEFGAGTSRFDYHRYPAEVAIHPNRSILTLYHGRDKWGDFPPNTRGFFWLLAPPAPRPVPGRRP